MTTPKKRPPKLLWPTLSDRFKYPLVETGQLRSVPLRPLASTIGCSFESLATALAQLPRDTAREVGYLNDNGRWSRSPAVAEHALDYLLYAWRGRRGRSQVSALRHCARELTLKSLLAKAPASDQAKVMNEVLHFQLEVERQKVLDRDRQLEALRATRPGAALVHTRWKSPATKEKFLEVAELQRQGAPLAEIADRLGLSKGVVVQFLQGKYRTAAATEAYADLQARSTAKISEPA